MARPKRFTITPVNDTNNIATTQTPSAGGAQALTLVSSPVTFTTPHKAVITATGDESGRTFTIVGLDGQGQPKTEVVTGPNTTTAASAAYWLQIDSVTVDANTANSVIVGTTGLCASPWYPVDRRSKDFGIGFGCEISTGGAMTYTVQHTFDDLQSLDETITTFDHENVIDATASDDGNYAFSPAGIRLVVTAFTSGSIQFNISPT